MEPTIGQGTVVGTRVPTERGKDNTSRLGTQSRSPSLDGIEMLLTPKGGRTVAQVFSAGDTALREKSQSLQIDTREAEPQVSEKVALDRTDSTSSRSSVAKIKKPQKYKNSVGGHHLLLSLGDGRILKECARREEKFYVTLAAAEGLMPVLKSPEVGQFGGGSRVTSTPELNPTTPSPLKGENVFDVVLSLRRYIPRFFGHQTLPTQELQQIDPSRVGGASCGLSESPVPFDPASSANPPPPKPSLDEPSGSDYVHDKPLRMLVLQDIMYGYEHPCVLDMKMGTRQYGLYAPDRKVESKTRKARESTSEKLGCRMSGWQKWSVTEGKLYKADKYVCRKYTESEFVDTLRFFLNHDVVLMERFREEVNAMKDIFSSQNALRLYTSSILLVYDAARPRDSARVFMVDFAYCYSMDEVRAAQDIAAYSERDDGYYLGLKTLSKILGPQGIPDSRGGSVDVCVSLPYSLGVSPSPPATVPVQIPTSRGGDTDTDPDGSLSAT